MLAEKPVEFVNDHIRAAEVRIERGEDALDNGDFGREEDQIVDALLYLGEADNVLGELPGEQREDLGDEIGDLKEDAREVWEDIVEERAETASRGPNEDEDDSSGSGSGGSDD